MAEHEDKPPVGSVAEEAARLLDALGGWASTATAGYAAPRAPGAPTGDQPRESDEQADESTAEPATGPTDHPAAGRTDHSGGRCEACGAQNGVGQALTCQLCPVCQGIGFLRSVRPETVDRLADLAGAIAVSLRDLASQRRGGARAAGGRPDTDTGGRGRASTVQDIRIEDEDHPADAAAEVPSDSDSDTRTGSTTR